MTAQTSFLTRRIMTGRFSHFSLLLVAVIAAAALSSTYVAAAGFVQASLSAAYDFTDGYTASGGVEVPLSVSTANQIANGLGELLFSDSNKATTWSQDVRLSLTPWTCIEIKLLFHAVKYQLHLFSLLLF